MTNSFYFLHAQHDREEKILTTENRTIFVTTFFLFTWSSTTSIFPRIEIFVHLNPKLFSFRATFKSVLYEVTMKLLFFFFFFCSFKQNDVLSIFQPSAKKFSACFSVVYVKTVFILLGKCKCKMGKKSVKLKLGVYWNEFC